MTKRNRLARIPTSPRLCELTLYHVCIRYEIHCQECHSVLVADIPTLEEAEQAMSTIPQPFGELYILTSRESYGLDGAGYQERLEQLGLGGVL